MRPFIGRKHELALLDNAYTSKSAFVMLNGRQRVGKTALVRYFLRDKRALFFTAKEEVDLLSRRRFLKTFGAHCKENVVQSAKVPSWKMIFKAFAERVETSRKVLVIDNVGSLIQGDPSFSKSLKYAWENYFKQASIMLIIIMPNNSLMVNLEGSHSSFISCVTTQLKLKPVSFIEMLKDSPQQDFANMMSLYAITGGVPKYWEFFVGCEAPIDYMGVIRSNILSPNGFLYEEGTNLIERDVWEPSAYNSVLKAVSEGYRKPAEIAKYVGMRSSQIGHCLENLITLGYLEARVPITEKRVTVSNRKVQYYFADAFMHFWYTFVFENKEVLDVRKDLPVFEGVKRSFPGYIQYWFKNICLEIFQAACKQGGVPFKVDRIGSFWNKNDETIDIVAIDEQKRQIFFGDCRYSNKTYTMEAYDTFMENCEDIREFKVYKDYSPCYGFFNIGDFEPNLMDYALITDHIYLFSGVRVYSKK